MLQVPRLWTCSYKLLKSIQNCLINRVPVVESESDSNEFIFQSGEINCEVDEAVIGDDFGLSCIKPTSIHLSVIKYLV